MTSRALKILSVPVHAHLFLLLYVLSLYQVSMEHLPFYVVTSPLLVGVGIVAVAVALFSLVLRSLHYGAAVTSVLIFTMLLFPSVGKQLVPHSRAIMFTSIICCELLFFGTMRVKRLRLAGLSRALNLIALCCLLSTLVTITGYAVRTGLGRPNDELFCQDWKIPGESIKVEPVRPDIVFLVLDGYARQDVLRALYGFSNEKFINFLENEGFYVASNSRANYCQTVLSLSSALNANYLTIEKQNRRLLHCAIQQSSIPLFLKEQGYRIVVNYSGYRATDRLLNVRSEKNDRRLDYSVMEFEGELLKKSLLGFPRRLQQVVRRTRTSILDALGGGDLLPFEESHRLLVTRTLDKVAAYPLVADDPPTLLFSHVISPHPPFVLGDLGPVGSDHVWRGFGDGSHLVSKLAGGGEEYRSSYVRQLQGLNRLVAKMIEARLTSIDRETVIVILSDHGPGSEVDWDDASASNGWERLSNFCAIYCSDGDYSDFYSEITPINVWRTILSKYFFDIQLERLPDRSFMSPWKGFMNFREYRP